MEAFVVDNVELESLEAYVGQFNIFEALGAVRQEVRHSDLLAFLLDPTENHGLDDLFARKLLQRAISSAGDPELPVSPIDLDVWDLDELIVRREWQNIDILLEDPVNQFIVVIENKVVSSEHSGQLLRYREITSHAFPSHKALYIFLTPEGEPPSDDAYIPIGYETIALIVENFVETRASVIGPDVRTLMSHYTEMLRRHVVSESEIADLARRIYRKHKHALEIIFEYRPDLQADLRQALEDLIQAQPGFKLDHCSKSYIRFLPESLDDIPALHRGQGWTYTQRLLLFEIVNAEERLALKLIIGPGDQNVRELLFQAAKNRGAPFRPSQKNLAKKHQTIYVDNILTARNYIGANLEDLLEKIRAFWKELVNIKFPEIDGVIKSLDYRVSSHPRP